MHSRIGLLIERLTSASGAELQRAILESGMVLEQSNKLESYDRVVADPRRLSEMEPDYLPNRRDQILREYANYAGMGIISSELLGLRLSNDDRDALTRALIGLLDRGPPIAIDAASAISYSGRLFAVSSLAQFVIRYAHDDNPAAASAIRALSELLNSRAVLNPEDWTPAETDAVRSAVDAVQFAAREGANGTLRAKEEAQRQLNRISRWMS